MLLIVLLKSPQPYNWTTDPTVLAWIAVASLIVGVASIIIGFGGGYWFYQKGKNYNRVIYDVISDTPIVSVREQTGKGKIKVSYETGEGHSEEINDARLLTLSIWNDGNGDVIIWNASDKDKANLEEPIVFDFEERTVVGLTHLETFPDGEVLQQKDREEYLNSPSPTPTCLSLPRCILKQDQLLQLGILLNGPSGNIRLKEGKLLNGEIVNRNDLRKRTRTRKFIGFILFLSLTVITSVVLIITPLHLDFSIILVIDFSLVYFAFVFLNLRNLMKALRRILNRYESDIY